MSFNSDASSSSEAIKQECDQTVEQLSLYLDMRHSKRLAKTYLFMMAVTVIGRTLEDGLRFVNKLTEAVLKYIERTYDVILSFTMCRLGIREEKEKEKESQKLE